MPILGCSMDRQERQTRHRILIVEDENDLVELLSYTLIRDGYDVITAADGETALQRATYEHPDLVLLDVLLPGLDGFAVCELMRSHDATRSIPVVMMTSWTTSHARELGRELGAQDYITKPFSIRELKRRIDTAITD